MNKLKKERLLAGLTLVLTLVFALGSIQIARAAVPTLGELEDNIYTNEYFGLTITLPEGWSVPNKEIQKKILSAGKNMVAGNDEELQKQLDLGELNSFNLLFVSKYPIGSPVVSNPNLICIAERLPVKISIEKYLLHSKKLLQKTQIPYQFGEKIKRIKISGRDFAVMEAYFENGSAKISQEYYCGLFDNYILNFILSFSSEEEAEEVRAILATVQFK